MNATNLKIAYVVLSLLMSIVLLLIGLKAINSTTPDNRIAKRKKIVLIIGLVFWQVYVYLIACSGVLDNFDFPPRFFLLLILPLFLFTGIFIYIHRNSDWIINVPVYWLIFYQSFRILVESIFVFSVAQGILNQEVTIQGYNYDMVFAFTAPVVGYLALKGIAPLRFLKLWNYLGLLVIASIIFLFISSIFNPQLFGSDTMLLPEMAVKYPYVLVAGFLMPSAVFIHVLSIVQLSRKEGQEFRK